MCLRPRGARRINQEGGTRLIACPPACRSGCDARLPKHHRTDVPPLGKHPSSGRPRASRRKAASGKTAAGVYAGAHEMKVPSPIEEIPRERLRLVDWSRLYRLRWRSRSVFAPPERVGHRQCRSLLPVAKQKVEGGRYFARPGTLCEYSPDVMMSTKQLNAIREIDPKSHTVTCEPGITPEELHRRSGKRDWRW